MSLGINLTQIANDHNKVIVEEIADCIAHMTLGDEMLKCARRGEYEFQTRLDCTQREAQAVEKFGHYLEHLLEHTFDHCTVTVTPGKMWWFFNVLHLRVTWNAQKQHRCSMNENDYEYVEGDFDSTDDEFVPHDSSSSDDEATLLQGNETSEENEAHSTERSDVNEQKEDHNESESPEQRETEVTQA